MALIEFENDNNYSACIKVVGIGGGGTNAVNSMVRDNIRGVEFLVANTDVQSLEASECPGKIQVGTELTRGLGAGSNPEVGQRAALESEDQIREALEGELVRFLSEQKAILLDLIAQDAGGDVVEARFDGLITRDGAEELDQTLDVLRRFAA